MISQRVLTQPLHLLLLCSRSSNTGKIVGGVVGAVAGLAILAGALVLYFRRRRVLGLGAMQESRVDPYPDTMMEMVESVATPATGVRATDPGAVRKLAMEEAAPTQTSSQPIMSSMYPAAPSGQPSSRSTADATASAAAADASQATDRQPSQGLGSDSEAAIVERLFHLIADRFERIRGSAATQSEYSTGDILPEYAPPGYPGA